MINFGTNRNWYWESGLEEVRFQIIDDGVPILCRVSPSWIDENLDVDGDDSGLYLEAAKDAFDLICDEIRLYLSQDRRQEDGSILLAGSLAD